MVAMKNAPVKIAPVIAALVALLAASVPSYATDTEIQPESGTGIEQKSGTDARQEMVVAANPHAAKAGAQILADGGSAIDAAIAMQMVLNLVEPQSSGIGGGAFLLHYDGRSGVVRSYDGRETAPASAAGDLFLGPDGTKPGYFDAVIGGRSVGVPGLMRMLALAHEEHGILPWADLFAPAIWLSETGFAISPRLHNLAGRVPTLARFPDTAAYFLTPDGKPKAVGTLLRNRPFAATLRAIAAGGADNFYGGEIAKDIVTTVQDSALHPGGLTMRDMAGYAAKPRPPVCLGYRGYRVCGMGPPSSGGVTILQILGILAHFDSAELDPNSADAVHLFAEASRLAYADRDRYLADADFVAVPVNGLLDPAYLAARAELIDPSTAASGAAAGSPPGAEQARWISAESPELPSTSHLSVVDRDGNAVAMTTSIEFAFGSALMVRGFLLNNQLTDFSFTAERDGALVANRVEGGKRPRSSMAPTIVLDPTGRLRLVIGSPGGSRIICYVASAVIGVIDWGLDAQEAAALPHMCNRGGATELEKDTVLAGLEAELVARGHAVKVRDLNSGLHVIATDHDDNGRILRGGADPRREGRAIGH
jgi:gamma-glutamyltranspeptidase/glutathione hydrolase